MADNTGYTAKEVDDKLNNLKTELMDQINGAIVMNSDSTAPSTSGTSMWMKITNVESE